MELAKIKVVLTKPKHTRLIGLEMIDLASVFERMSDAQITHVVDPVRDGFAYNFATESSPATGQWAELRPRTQREREAAGFGREHPILDRHGHYKRSWTESSHPKHRQDIFRMASMFGPGEVNVVLGSHDPRAEARLEGGGMSSDASGPVEARPVRFIEKMFEDRMGRRLDWLLTSWAGRVKPRA